MRRLGVALAIGAAAWVLPYSAASVVLLPAKISAIDEANKVPLLALLVALGSIAAIVTNVVFGVVSDLTRSRFGRRNPWVIGGGIGSAIFMALLATAQSYPMLVLWWCLYEAALSAIVVALVAVVPDRVPHLRRGTVSGVYGAGQLIGGTIGAVIGARFVVSTGPGFMVLAVVAIVLPVVFVLLAPDFSNRGAVRQRLTRTDFVKSFAFPRKAPDFYWAFLARLLIILGYYVIGGYQLYILTDYMHLDQGAAAAIISTAALINLVTAIIGSLASGPLSDRIRRRKVIVIIASVLIGLGAVTPFLFAQPWAMLVFAGVGGLGLGVYFSVDAALMSEVLPNENTRGKDLGILNIAGSGGQILAPLVSAGIVSIGIGFAPIFVVTFALCVLAALAIVPIKKVR